MKKYDVVLLTEAKYMNPQNVDWYTDQVLTEDNLVLEALQKKGVHAIKRDWADPNFDWSSTRYALFRTTWDYFHRFQEFEAWLKSVSQQTKLINPIELIRWNMDKHYLLDLAEKGIPIINTYFVEQGTELSLRELHEHTGWTDTVIKPAISGAARHTYRVNKQTMADHEVIFSKIIEHETMMIQPFQHNIESQGEVSLVVIDGFYCHAVLKKAKEGDYRVQDDWGGTVHPYKPSEEEIDLAENIVRTCDPMPTYARVDLMRDNDNQLALCELELVEPELWFRKNPQAAAILANAIHKML